MAEIAFNMAIGPKFSCGGNPLPTITPSLLEKSSDWTDEESTALILYRLFTKELEANILEENGLLSTISLEALFEERGDAETGLVELKRLWTWKRTPVTEADPTLLDVSLAYRRLAIILYFFEDPLEERDEACDACADMNSQGPSGQCLIPPEAIVCVNCYYSDFKCSYSR